MNLTGLQDFMKAQRQKEFSSSNQMSLGQIIDKIEKIGVLQENGGEPKEMQYDFGTAIPTCLDSWRGSYSELALGYGLTGYDNQENHFGDSKADKLLDHLKEAIGKEYTGWKGGEFLMDESTPVWVANPGDSGNTGIIDVVDDGWRIIIMTAYCEY